MALKGYSRVCSIDLEGGYFSLLKKDKYDFYHRRIVIQSSPLRHVYMEKY